MREFKVGDMVKHPSFRKPCRVVRLYSNNNGFTIQVYDGGDWGWSDIRLGDGKYWDTRGSAVTLIRANKNVIGGVVL